MRNCLQPENCIAKKVGVCSCLARTPEYKARLAQAKIRAYASAEFCARHSMATKEGMRNRLRKVNAIPSWITDDLIAEFIDNKALFGENYAIQHIRMLLRNMRKTP